VDSAAHHRPHELIPNELPRFGLMRYDPKLLSLAGTFQSGEHGMLIVDAPDSYKSGVSALCTTTA
jgi:hypothetical protein